MNQEEQKERVESLTKDQRSDVMHRAKAREIVQTILEYGVSQSQIFYIIKFLSLELEDVQVMQNISEILDNSERFAEMGGLSGTDEGSSPRKTKIYT
jgi:hypothetical protein